MEELDYTIDMKDLLKRILKKWKSVLAASVAAAVLIGGCAYLINFMDIKSTAEYMAANANSFSFNASSFAKKLNPQELEEVTDAYEDYCTYKLSLASAEKILQSMQYGEGENKAETVASVAAIRQSASAECDSLSEKISEMEKMFSGVQAELLETLMAEYEQIRAENEDLSELYEVPGAGVSKKLVVICFLLGGIIVCSSIALKYIFSASLRTADDLPATFGVSLIAEIEDSGTPGGDCFCADVILTSKNKNYSSVFIAELFPEGDAEQLRNLAGNISASGLSCVSAPVSDVANLHKLAASEACILAARIDVTKYKDISSFLEQAERFGVPVMGAVVIK